ncbi:hypothetical protein Pfo_000136 [Paulownia fortunei]|nr:hypothetical protein Pfo_000136 [Paulownia fortunei]
MWRLKIAEGGGRWLTTTNNHTGRQHWEFDGEAAVTAEEVAQLQSMREDFKKKRFRCKQSCDLIMRMQLRKENPSAPIPPAIKIKGTEDVTDGALTTTLRRALSFFSTIQAHDGHWPAESAGPLFFLPPLDNVLSPEHKKEILRYTYNHQNEDGGWGLHVEGHSTMFGSVLNYVTLRLLGERPEEGEEGAVSRGRKWILEHGDAVGIPSWGKFWLTVLGVHEWAGCNPAPPELWLLPTLFPIHPGMMLCYARLVYMPMSYLYGKRFVGPKTALVQSLRQELYNQPYEKINWNKARKTCAKEDLYYPHHLIQDVIWEFLHNVAEPVMTRWPFSRLREKAMKVAMEHVHYKDKNSNYLCIGCIEKELCLLACWVEAPNSEAYKRHLARIPDYFWIAEDGMKLQTFGSQTWDTSLAIQAILSSNFAEEYGPTLRKAYSYLRASQVQANPSGKFSRMYRHISKGSWTFAIQDHGWQASDCTAEALKAAILLSNLPSELVGEKIEIEHLYEAVDVIMSLQNSSGGGFSSWEPMKAPSWMEVRVQIRYTECTSSAIQALLLFKKLHPEYRTTEIACCIRKAVQYIESTQNTDGSWYGCWGVCFTYGTWYAVAGLKCSALRKACEFLISKQLPDGGWGESYQSCSNKVYTNFEDKRSNLVQTSWALLALMDAGQAEIDPLPIRRGIKLLINSQLDNGDFPQQENTGAFMRNCVLHYASYRNVFPIWAMSEYCRVLSW